MNRVQFTKDEAGWFSRNVLKMKQLMEVAASKDAKILDRTTYKALASMTEQAEIAGKADTEVIDVMLNRKQKLVLKELVQSVRNTLVSKVIPEYERRGIDHSVYLERAKIKSEQLGTIIRKLK